MAQVECVCKTGLFNLGSVTCITKPGIIKKLIFVEYFKDDGGINGLDLSTVINEASIDLLLNNPDKNLRWFPTKKVKNFVTDRADPTFEDIDGQDHFIEQGVRTMSGDFTSYATPMIKNINGMRCTEVGVYAVDENNGILGVVTRNNFLDPIKLSQETIWAKGVLPTVANIWKISFSSQWDKDEADGDLRILKFNDHGTDMLKKEGLVDVFARNGTALTTTEIEIDIFMENGSTTGEPFVGLLSADFILNNVTLVTTPAFTSLEDPNIAGRYKLTFADVDVNLNDLLTVEVIPKPGFDFAATTNEVITAL